MKHLFSTVLFFLAVSCTVLGQTPNVPTLRLDAQQIVAEVNGDKISRSSLVAECLQLHGEKELDELIWKTLIRLECERLKITITAEEINDEIVRMAKTFGMSSEDWLKLLEQDRNISLEQYKDNVWRILALAKLAGPRLNPSEAELKEAFDAEFGPAVQVRQVVLATKADANKVLAELKQNPEAFAAIAKNQSIDPVSAPYGGRLPPIRRGSFNNPQIENMLFAMKTGDISPIVETYGGHFTIFLCEGHLKPLDIDMKAVKDQLSIKIRNAKIQSVSNAVFREMQSKAKVQIVFGNPALYTQYPGVAALLNGQKIYQNELAEICVKKHGVEVLSEMIDWLIIAQACRKEKIVITEQDIDNEIREMASNNLALLQDGSPNVALWLRMQTEKLGLSIPVYRKNVVVPLLSLKKITRRHIIVMPEEVQKAFEANFGPRAKCLAIVFPAQQQRKALEVWAMANRNKTESYFGDLAKEFSFDHESQQNRGVISPIARHCGNPDLEKEAFSLETGELSQIVQVDELLVILFSLGFTEQMAVKFEDVEADLLADIYEKKLKIAIDRHFERLSEQAVIDNRLTGHTQNIALEGANPLR
jgi:parvulin-like peptidyl-prolyl isomerase